MSASGSTAATLELGPTPGPAWTLARAAARHGLPILGLSAALAFFAPAREELLRGLVPAASEVSLHLLAFASIAVGLLLAICKETRPFSSSGARTGYFLGIAIAEEWTFRIALPIFLLGATGPATATFASNLAFGLLHRVTLGWTWTACALAVLAGCFLSRLYAHTFSFASIVAAHWVLTVAVYTRPRVLTEMPPAT